MKEVFDSIIDKLEDLHAKYINQYGIVGSNPGAMAVSRCIRTVEEVQEEYNGGWIPFKQREMDEEELRCIGKEFGYILDCKLPEEDEEIIVTYKNGTVGEDIFLRDGNECYLDSGNDFVTEAIAWMPKPAPYQPKGE